MEIRTLEGLLADRKMTQDDFATLMGISRQTLSNKMNNKSEWKACEIDKACGILGISVNEGISLFLR